MISWRDRITMEVALMLSLRLIDLRCCLGACLLVVTPSVVWAQPTASLGSSSASAAGAPAPPPPAAWFAEPRFIGNAINFASRFDRNGGRTKSGFYPELSNLDTGAGWLSVGPGYRHYLFDKQLFVDGSTAVSWHM
jgi:hypothetical protein